MERHDEKGRPARRPHSAGLATHSNSSPAILAAGRPSSTEIDRYTALEWLRRGRLLHREHTPNGILWSIGGCRIAGRIARQLLRYANIEPHDRGLFDGLEQSYRLR
jgi:hypothetical protein